MAVGYGDNGGAQEESLSRRLRVRLDYLRETWRNQSTERQLSSQRDLLQKDSTEDVNGEDASQA